MLVETSNDDGSVAQIVYKTGGPVSPVALENLCTKVRLSFMYMSGPRWANVPQNMSMIMLACACTCTSDVPAAGLHGSLAPASWLSAERSPPGRDISGPG